MPCSITAFLARRHLIQSLPTGLNTLSSSGAKKPGGFLAPQEAASMPGNAGGILAPRPTTPTTTTGGGGRGPPVVSALPVGPSCRRGPRVRAAISLRPPPPAPTVPRPPPRRGPVPGKDGARSVSGVPVACPATIVPKLTYNACPVYHSHRWSSSVAIT
jgi:hypothetical protein